jgi:hypothetical protein
MTLLQKIKDAVTYQRIHYPMFLNEIVAYFQVMGFKNVQNIPYSEQEIAEALNRAAYDGKVIPVKNKQFYFFPDMPVMDRDYLWALLKIIIKRDPRPE